MPPKPQSTGRTSTSFQGPITLYNGPELTALAKQSVRRHGRYAGWEIRVNREQEVTLLAYYWDNDEHKRILTVGI